MLAVLLMLLQKMQKWEMYANFIAGTSLLIFRGDNSIGGIYSVCHASSAIVSIVHAVYPLSLKIFGWYSSCDSPELSIDGASNAICN